MWLYPATLEVANYRINSDCAMRVGGLVLAMLLIMNMVSLLIKGAQF